MSDFLKQMLAKPNQLAAQVMKASDKSNAFKQECLQMKSKTEALPSILHQMSQSQASTLYVRLIRRVMDDVEQALDGALSLVLKCCGSRLMIIIPASCFPRVLTLLEASIGDVTWLLSLILSNNTSFSLPPVAANDPSLALVWSYIPVLCKGSSDDQHAAALELLSISQNNDKMKRLIIEELGISPFLKWLKDSKKEVQQVAAMIIRSLGHDSGSVERIIDAGAFQVFVKILKDGSSMKVQAEVSSAISELAAIHPKCQDICIHESIISLLIRQLSFGTIQENVQNHLQINKATSVLAVVMASNHLNKTKVIDDNFDDDNNQNNHCQPPSQLSYLLSGWHSEDPDTKSYMKAMAARALWQLVKGNLSVCRIITESRAIFCFAILLQKGQIDVRYHSAMALMEITAIAEQDTDLRRTVFRANSPTWKVVMDAFSKTIHKDSPQELVMPCINAVGNLTRTFRVADVRIINLLVQFIDKSQPEQLAVEALIALGKLTCKENQVHIEHSRAIVSAGLVGCLMHWVTSGDQNLRSYAFAVLQNVAVDVPISKELDRNNVYSTVAYYNAIYLIN